MIRAKRQIRGVGGFPHSLHHITVIPLRSADRSPGVWFVGTGRPNAAAHIHGVAARLRRVQREADECDEALAELERAHGELQRQVEEAEQRADELRRQRMEAFERFWVTREQRDRARHVSRRLHRRLQRLQRRIRPSESWAGG